jgi:RND family efflux transporter MFP subunit
MSGFTSCLSSFNRTGGGNETMKSCIALLLLAATFAAPARGADDVQVSAVLVKLIEQVEVPAREAGVLASLAVREGEMVKSGVALAQIEDTEAQFAKRAAAVELLAARKQAESDVKVRYARKSLEVAEAELRRAVDSRKRLPESVSQSELDQLRLLVDRSSLEIEQAQLELELAQAARELKEVDVQSAEHDIQKRKIMAPLAGFVVEVNRHRGEWVEPGQTILRILRLDRLRAEGLVNAQAVTGDLLGRRAKLSVTLDGTPQEFVGKIVFVSPEIDPVNGQVRVWAEIDNPQLTLRPGLHGSMTIERAAAGAQ